MPQTANPRQRSILSLISLFDVISSYGEDPQAIMAVFDFDLKQHSGNALISQELEFSMVREALKRLEHPMFGFKVGSQSTFSSYGIYALTVMTAPHFRDACHSAAEFQQLSLLYMPMTLHYHSDYLEIRYTLPAVAPALREFIADRDFAGTYSFMSELVDNPVMIPMECGVARPKPDGELLQAYHELCHAGVKFDQTFTWFRFPTSVMGLDIKHSNTLAHQLYRVQAADLMRRLYESETDLVARCKQLLEGFEFDWPDAKQLARQLETSERSLRRHLKQSHTSLRELIDNVRMERAKLSIASGTDNIAQLAERLGYSESASFVRAFKRWTGQTPSSFRKLSHTAQENLL